MLVTMREETEAVERAYDTRVRCGVGWVELSGAHALVGTGGHRARVSHRDCRLAQRLVAVIAIAQKGDEGCAAVLW